MKLRWRLIPVPESEAVSTDLTGAELIGISIMLTLDRNYDQKQGRAWGGVYARAWEKIQPQVTEAEQEE